jgi:hypothetical protein
VKQRDDSGLAAVIGAVVVLAVLGTTLLYVNAFHVPRQGAALETQGAESTQSALLGLASALSRGADAPLAHDVPLRTAPAAPPLLAGVVLSPARSEGELGLNATGSRIRVSVVLDAPAGGVPAADPTRVDLGGGRMRHYLLGNATAGLPLGALDAHVGGVYSERVEYRVEGGALLATREGRSTLVAPPALDVGRVGATTSVGWRVPLLGGPASAESGGEVGQVLLRPGPEAEMTTRAYQLSIRVETSDLAGWTAALQRSVGANGFVNATQVGAPDNGTVEALILAPPGTLLTERAVVAELVAVRYETSIAQRG